MKDRVEEARIAQIVQSAHMVQICVHNLHVSGGGALADALCVQVVGDGGVGGGGGGSGGDGGGGGGDWLFLSPRLHLEELNEMLVLVVE